MRPGQTAVQERSSSQSSPHACFHGGASFEAIGARFDDLSRREQIINADVLDAWFDPAPGVIAALRDHLPWLLRTSPPTHAEGLFAAIAEARGVPEASLALGAGSSDLVFRVLPRWLSRKSRALILDPTYGEYAHVLENVIGCRVDRIKLRRAENFDLPCERLVKAMRRGYDLVVLVNPNNPTGRFAHPDAIAALLDEAPVHTRFWIDEAYVDYLGPESSLERLASTRSNVFICKTMSKGYALSGLRVGYLCGEPKAIAPIRAITPPWVVGLPAQVAAVEALRDPGYYASCYQATHDLREALASSLDLEYVPSRTNAILAFLPEDGPTATEIIAACRTRGLFLRDPGLTTPGLGRHALRLAVKDAATNLRMVHILDEVRREAGSGRREGSRTDRSS
jgi:histidinol-phosphate/aromatic aminotransferase/cobyric acid decarboxylase-like protein